MKKYGIAAILFGLAFTSQIVGVLLLIAPWR